MLWRPSVFATLFFAAFVAAALSPAPVWAHAEHDKARFVASDGEDAGACDNVFRPCRTVGYAASRAAKGDRLLLAGGTYQISDGEELFYLTSGIIQAFGGYSRFDHFARQAALDNPTTLVGVPVGFRDELAARGFKIIADRKGLEADSASPAARLTASFRALKQSTATEACAGGSAAGFPCANVDLVTHLALEDFSSRPNAANDVWGLIDLNTEREYAIIGLRNGTAVVDISDAANPVELGTIAGASSTWRDIKVYQFYDASAARWKAYAYVTTDSGSDGLVIIDLTELPNTISLAARRVDDSSAHNVYIANVDYSTGLPLGDLAPVLHIAGSNRSGGGFRAYDLVDPTAPALISQSPGGYMHDATSLIIEDSRKDTQCVNATAACAVLVDFNETTFEFWDLSATANPAMLSSSTYANRGYVHSGWWSEDKQYVFVHDELDERDAGLRTTLRVFDITNLNSPSLVGTWSGATDAIDHNGFVRGNRYYMSNYTRGLTILDITDATNPTEVGRFDTFPVSNATAFNGAWGVYPFLPSGNLLVSDINSGLYVLADGTLTTDRGRLAFTAAYYGALEGDTVSVEVARLGGATGAVSVAYELVAGSAGEADFTPASGTLSWPDGDAAAKTVSVPLAADASAEDVERLFVRLANPAGGATLDAPAMTSVFVSEAGAAAELEFADSSTAAGENAGRALVTVRRRGSAEGAVTVNYRTEMDTAGAGSDFVQVDTGTLQWADRDATGRTVSIELIDDAVQEGDETFRVVLFSPSGATVANPDTTVVIVDNETANSAPVANAGGNLTAAEGSQVTLDGSQSSDPDNDALSFDWTQLGGPVVSIVNADQPVAQFAAPQVSTNTTLTFQLRVTDTSGTARTDNVAVTVTNTSAPSGGGGGGGGSLGIWLLLWAGLCRALSRERCRAPRAP